MGIYVNPDNAAFQESLNADIYIDKTMMLAVLNKDLRTTNKYLCVSRPRRFGKSIAGNMIAAYYSRGADSRAMFEPYKISKDMSFETHLNKYNVLKLDLNGLFSEYPNKAFFFDYLNSELKSDFVKEFSEIDFSEKVSIAGCIKAVYEKTKIPFVIILDEYDVFVREKVDEALFQQYLSFLISIFKNAELSPAVALAYITGILPIVRDKIQSKLNVFTEYTILDARRLAPFTGFTADEVESLCVRYDMDFAECRRWYDGYKLNDIEIYNPKSVVEAMYAGKCRSFWSITGSYDAISMYINLNLDDTRDEVIKMLGGAKVDVEVSSFLNTMKDFRCKDDVFTYLIHIGYLAYDEDSARCYIPNREIRDQWVLALRNNEDYKPVIEIVNNSKQLLESTINCDGEAVAEILNKTHSYVTNPLTYNNEGSFQSAICLAFFYANLKYTIVKELPTGKGYADVALIPYLPNIPAIIIELKNNRTPEAALRQIKDRKYDDLFEHYRGQMLFVGVNYDSETKEHSCTIEKFEY